MDVENVKVNIKRFLSNPNTMTFLLVIVLIVVETNALIKKLISIQIIYLFKIREDFFIMKN